MIEQQKQDIAQAMEIEPELLPYLPELLADFYELGSSPPMIVDFLKPLGLPDKAGILDLGCGKGAVSITLAKELGFQMMGIDFFPPFIQEAQRLAQAAGVDKLCRFEYGNIRERVPQLSGFDGLVFASVGGVWGDIGQCLKELRQTVRSGGFIIIDDCFLEGDKKIEDPGFAYYNNYKDTRRGLSQYGDHILRETVISDGDIKDMNRLYMNRFHKRAVSIKQAHPEMAARLENYLKNQEKLCRLMESNLKSAIWLLQKA
jgi:SAM-dependent methyltransferase